MQINADSIESTMLYVRLTTFDILGDVGEKCLPDLSSKPDF